MKLCILSPDNQVSEILMSNKQPTLDRINNEILLFENYRYKLIIHDDINYESMELFLGDYSIPLHHNTHTDCFETDVDLIFEGCYDLAYMTIYVDDKYDDENVFFTEYFRIATTKQTTKQVELMLQEIEENLPNFLEVCFSKNKKKSGLIKNDMRSVWNTLHILDEIINAYEENFGNFSNHKKATIEHVATIVDARSMRIIDQESLRWIACNPENLHLTKKNTGIVINEQNYMPSKVKTYVSKYSYNVYENQIVLGFLQNLISYLENQIVGFERKIKELENIPEAIITQLPNTHELTGRCVYIYYKGIMKKFCKRKEMLQEIYNKYERMLDCLPLKVYGIPQLTNTFKQVYHYRVCYEYIVKWFEAGDYTFEHLNYLFKLKTLSRIFEYFCLIKFQIALSSCGYVLNEANRLIYDDEDNVEEINNQYIYSGNGYEITLLYEPTIWTNKTCVGINLYSTGYNFSKGKWSEKWTPDFVIKILYNTKEYYYILDAKFSTFNNVRKYYMAELVLKYSSQIASINKCFSDVIGIGAVYPSDEEKIYHFKKNKVSSKQSFPKFFSMTIIEGEKGNIVLKENLKELLGQIEALQSEKEENGFSIAEYKREQFGNINLQQNSIGDIRATQNESHTLEQDFLEKVINENEYSSSKINGKKCFYYGKNLCMLKRARCDADEKGCKDYISKKSKELLKKEESCRNFIKYTRRGKVSRVECSVSGLAGCVGPDVCKFCMRKNKSRS